MYKIAVDISILDGVHDIQLKHDVEVHEKSIIKISKDLLKESISKLRSRCTW